MIKNATRLGRLKYSKKVKKNLRKKLFSSIIRIKKNKNYSGE